MTLADKKIALVHKILSMEKESVLDLADKAINQIQTDNGNHLNGLEFYVGNIEDKVDIDKINNEQAVKSLLMDELNTLIEEANFTEDIDELLASLQ